MMSKKTTQLIGGAIVVLAVVVLLYWALGSKPASAPQTTSTDNASSETASNTKTTQGGGTSQAQFGGSTQSSITSVIASIPEASRFYSLFNATGVSASMPASGTYTIFVPTNDAFSRLAKGTIDNLTTAGKKRLVQHHIVAGREIDVDAIESGMIESMAKEMLNFEIRDSDNAVMINSAFVVREYRAKNAIIYLISSVLLPPEPRGY